MSNIYYTKPTNRPDRNEIIFREEIGLYPIFLDAILEKIEGKICIIDDAKNVEYIDDNRKTFYLKTDSTKKYENKDAFLDGFFEHYTDKTPPDDTHFYKFTDLWVLDREFYIKAILSNLKKTIENIDKTYYNVIQFQNDSFDCSGRHSENIRILLNSNIDLSSVVWYSKNFTPYVFTREQYQQLFEAINTDIFNGIKKVYENKWMIEGEIESYSDQKILELYGNA